MEEEKENRRKQEGKMEGTSNELLQNSLLWGSHFIISLTPHKLKIIALTLLPWKLRPWEIKCFSDLYMLSVAAKLFLLHVTNILWKLIFTQWVLWVLKRSLHAEYQRSTSEGGRRKKQDWTEGEVTLKCKLNKVSGNTRGSQKSIWPSECSTWHSWSWRPMSEIPPLEVTDLPLNWFQKERRRNPVNNYSNKKSPICLMCQVWYFNPFETHNNPLG